jgi:hypothetical protein
MCCGDVVSPRGGWLDAKCWDFTLWSGAMRIKRKNTEGLRPDGQKAERGWKARFQAVLEEHGSTRVNGAQASEATKAHNAKVIFAGMHVWREKLNPPHRVEEPHNLTDKHIRALVRYWYEQGKKPKTMVGDLSVWRKGIWQ